MIKSLEELGAYTLAVAATLPSTLRDETVLEPPGLPRSDLESIAASVPGIPASYLAVLEKVRLLGVSLGFFRLYPRPRPRAGEDFVSHFLKASSAPENPFLALYREMKWIEVGAFEGDPLVLVLEGSTSRYAAGSILWFDIEEYGAGRPAERPLAPDFESFVLLAGNLEQVVAQYEDDPEAIVGEFTLRLSEFSLSEENRENWRRLLSMSL